ncbi:MAG: hypothetical protein GF317_21300 [Candidatus Lokiarchaeota archaeon]|nr:hypothetical protein [Candidatus Lokiarchaeota archaeon]MBD3201993.1 hypothetical protein [Candidatus Lokiarchaeota archaeon]
MRSLVNLERYFESGSGELPIVFSSPHGGYKRPRKIKDIVNGAKFADRATYLISRYLIDRLLKEKIEIFYIFSKIHRNKIDFNRPPNTNNALNQDANSKKEAKQIHSYYHQQIQSFVSKSIEKYGICFFIDFHGFTKPFEEYPDIIFGNLFGNTLNIRKRLDDDNLDGEGNFYYWGYSELLTSLKKHFKTDDGLGITDYNLAYSGGYITYQFYERKFVNAIQLEISLEIRKNLNSLKKFSNEFIASINEVTNRLNY